MNQKMSKKYWDERAKRAKEEYGLDAVCFLGLGDILHSYIHFLQKRSILSGIAEVNFQRIRTLDLGCGAGRWSLELEKHGHDVIGIDFSKKMLKLANKKLKKKSSKVSYVNMSSHRLGFCDNCFDLVLCVTVLQHILDEKTLQYTMNEMVRVTAQNGRILLLELAPRKDLLIRNSKHTRERLPRFYKNEFEARGLKLINEAPVDPSPFLLWLERTAEKVFFKGRFVKDVFPSFSKIDYLRKRISTKYIINLISIPIVAVSLIYDLLFTSVIPSKETSRHKMFTFKRPSVGECTSLIRREVQRKGQYKTSVIIVTRDRPQELLKCLNSIMRVVRNGDEIIIVESGSKNLGHLKWTDKRIRYFHLSKPSRVEARNFGINVARNEIVAFVDDDSIVDLNWLQNLLSTYREHSEVGGVGGKLLSKSMLRPFGRPGGRIMPWGSVIHNLQTGENAVETDVLSGCNMSFKKDALLKAGGFDATYDGMCYREENDPQVRIKRLGYKLVYQPKAIVYHLESERGREIVTVKEHAKSRVKNHTYFYMKNYPLQNPLLIMLIPLFLLDIFLMLLIRYKNPLAFYHGFSGFLEAVSGFKDRIKLARSQQRLFSASFR